MKKYTQKLHKRLINIETISDNLKVACITMFIFGFVIAIILGISLNLELLKPLECLGIITVYLITIFFLYIFSELYPKAVLKMIMGEEMKQFSDNPYREFRNLVKNFKKEIREEGILEKDFDEAFYLRMKYFFENEFAEIIQKRKTEAATKEEIQKRKLEEQAEEGRKKMQEFSDKYSGNLELEKKS